MMRKIIAVIVCAVALFALLGCENEEAKSGEATVIGLTGGCPVYVKIKVDGDGKISEVKIDEFLSIYDIGKLDGEGSKVGIEVENEDGYAKYVKIGETTFEYSGGKYICDLPGKSDFESVVLSSGQWYARQMRAGAFDIVDGMGTPYNIPFNEYDGYKLSKTEWADKMKNGFHEGVEYENGWKEDIYKLITHLKNHAFFGYTGEETPNKKGTYKVGKFDTQVSLENFHDYMRLAQKAYEQARKAAK